MDTKDLPYLVVRIAALESIVEALLAERASGVLAKDIASLAKRGLARHNYAAETMADGTSFNTEAHRFIDTMVEGGQRLATATP